jgi:hypothetical protein
MAPNKGWIKEPMTTNSIANYGRYSNNPTCPNCDSANAFGEVGRNLRELERLKRRKRLTPCLELLENCGLSGDAAIFVLGQVGGEV